MKEDTRAISISRIVTSTENENIWGLKGLGLGGTELLLNGFRVSIYSNTNSILEIMCAGYTPWSVYLMLLNCTLKNGYKVANSVLHNLSPQKIPPKQNKTKILEEASGPQFTSSTCCHPMDPQAKPFPPLLCTWGPGQPATHTEATSGGTGESQAPPPHHNPTRRPHPAHRLPATLLTGRPRALGRRQGLRVPADAPSPPFKMVPCQ